MTSTLGLWATVVAFGLYHGLNPAMGWPLAVANGLTERRGVAVFATLLPLGTGHLLAMAVVLMPFAMLAWVVEWRREVQLAAAVLVMGFGAYKLVVRRHPRFLNRVRPTQLAWWSFLMATAHGAGLMLVPITLSLCAQPAFDLAGRNAATAVTVALVHTMAMVVSGVTMAWLVYRYLGLNFLRRGWFNLDAVWAVSLIVTGAVALLVAQLR